MIKIIFVAIATQLVFLAGEVLFAGYLSQKGINSSFYNVYFLVFSLTRIIGMAGQIYLWSEAQLGFIAALMGSCGLILSNLFGTFLLHQTPLSPQGYLGLSLAVVSIFLLTIK